MPRLPRYAITGLPQHVVQRGHNRQAIFLVDADKKIFRDILIDVSHRHECQVHAYVLMDNHIHLLVTPCRENSISKVMQSLGSSYVRYFNDTYRRSGTLWEGRYKATVLEPVSYLFHLHRYIEFNPVRAGRVRHPREYPWTSWHGNGEGADDPLLTPHPLYEELGGSPQARAQCYRQMFSLPMSKAMLNEIRAATQKEWALGDIAFKKHLEHTLNRPVMPKPRGGDRKSAAFRAQNTTLQQPRGLTAGGSLS